MMHSVNFVLVTYTGCWVVSGNDLTGALHDL